MATNKYRSSKFEKQKKRRRKIKTLIFTFLFLILFFGIIYLLNHDSVQVKEIKISDTTNIESEKMISIITEVTSQKYFGLISKNNIFFLPIFEIEEKLKNDFKAIEKIKIKRDFSRNMNVSLQEYKPVALWCGDSLQAKKDLCYLMDSRGYIFSMDNTIDLTVFPKFYGKLESVDIVDSFYTDTKTIELILNFIKGLEEMNIPTLFIETEDFETFAIKTTVGPYIFIEKNNKTSQILENLKIAIAQEDINKAQLKNLHYIDLRFSDKVFYKIGTPLDPKN